jgi:hypothetical protein
MSYSLELMSREDAELSPAVGIENTAASITYWPTFKVCDRVQSNAAFSRPLNGNVRRQIKPVQRYVPETE